MSCLGAFADNQFYVVLKDGSAESYPLDNVDSLTFDAPDGARVIGLADLLKKYTDLEARVSYLENNCCKDCDTTSGAHSGSTPGGMDGASSANPALASEIWSTNLIPASLLDEYYGGDTLIDMGLSVKWANFNVGAAKAYDFGNYFSWGDVEEKAFFDNLECFTDKFSEQELKEKGIIDLQRNLTPKHDAASVNWGTNYRIASNDEMTELFNNSEYKESAVDVNGKQINVVLLKSKINGSVLVIPCAGYYIGNGPKLNGSLFGEGEAYLWTSSATPNYLRYDASFCYIQSIGKENPKTYDWSRIYGLPVRAVENKPVSAAPAAKPSPAYMWNSDTVSVKDMHDYFYGIDVVDMGLSVDWATKNIGAADAYNFGDYYSWGETQTKEEYTNESCVTNYLSIEQLAEKGFTDENNNLLPKYDAATANWGEKFRMPTKQEVEELKESTEVKFYVVVDEETGKMYRGNLIQSKINYNIIFMPETGKKAGTDNEVYDENDGYADYLTSTAWETGGVDSWFYHSMPGSFWTTFDFRWYGIAIRPVAIK